MDRILAGLPFIFVYLDDVLVASPDHASHGHLREVLRRLGENGLTINPQKSVFSQEEVKFLGHQVSASGIRLFPGHVLEHPRADFPISLMVDPSGTHIGAILQHFRRLSWAPLSFFSKKLSSAETRYSALDRELLAVYYAICHFRLMLEGWQFFVLTEHKSLCHALCGLSAP